MPFDSVIHFWESLRGKNPKYGKSDTHENNHCRVIYNNNKNPWKRPYVQQEQN